MPDRTASREIQPSSGEEPDVTPQTFGPGGMMAMLDVCKTPPLAIPGPFPNIGMNVTAVPAYFTVMIIGMPWLNVGTTVAISNGDEAGAMGGVVSQIIIGPGRPVVGSTIHMVGGMPSYRTLDPTLQNVANAPGVATIPSQTIVTILR